MPISSSPTRCARARRSARSTVVQTTGATRPRRPARRLRRPAAPDRHPRPRERRSRSSAPSTRPASSAAFPPPRTGTRSSASSSRRRRRSSPTPAIAATAWPDGETLGDGLPVSFPAKLTKLLAARWRKSGVPLTLFPTELVPDNGVVLRGLCTGIAERSGLPPAFVAWLNDDCVFANSLVDRIVSTALEPAGAVAEPYALWAIERQDAARRSAAPTATSASSTTSRRPSG